MSASNASKQLGFGFLGALLAGGLLLAACVAPDGRARAGEPQDVVLREDGPGRGWRGSP
ncbi:hypothetical protein ACFCZ1_21630 [Streptomyces sp. NPDC056224]|uniref:hypothetical protein n=1 Tax=Streptomyces sp. NPDC056224 TaxID=3345750 RepID=UPI0035E12C57